jgi:hypothetical protein
MAAGVVMWCGVRSGGRVISACPDASSPAVEWIAVTSDHGVSRAEGAAVHLRQRRGSEGGIVERGEDPFHWLAEFARDRLVDDRSGDGWYFVLEARQFPGDGRWQQVGPGGERLAEFDEDPACILEGIPERSAYRLLGPLPTAAEHRERSQPMMSSQPDKLCVAPGARESRRQGPEGMRHSAGWYCTERHLLRTRYQIEKGNRRERHQRRCEHKCCVRAEVARLGGKGLLHGCGRRDAAGARDQPREETDLRREQPPSNDPASADQPGCPDSLENHARHGGSLP